MEQILFIFIYKLHRSKYKLVTLQKKMKRQLPYEISYTFLKRCRSIEFFLLWITLLVPIILGIIPCIGLNLGNCTKLCVFFDFLNVVYYISIILYAILYIIVEIIMQPMAASSRRKGLIDNSLGSHFLDKPVTNYYDNDTIVFGPYKILVNCFENCFFTYRLVKATLLKKVLFSFLLFLLFCFFAFYGVRNYRISMPFLQLFLSTSFLIEVVYHIVFYFRLLSLYERFRDSFSRTRVTKNEIIQDAFFMVLEYETTLAYNKSEISDAVYKRMKPQLTKEWDDMKVLYNIN